jgi:mannan endo-1,4-beta-mannosidase
MYSIDSNHLVALGDEGFYNRPGQPYPNGGSDGVDFDANLMISSLDFGTLHVRTGEFT